MNYSKTEWGQQAFKARSPALSARQRSAFILFDGVQSLAQVLAATAGLGVTPADVEHLLAQGYLAPVQTLASGAVAEASSGSERTPSQRYAEAYPLAIQLTAALGLRGFKLNLAVEAASGHEALLILLPRLQQAIGHEACRPLEIILQD